MAYLDYKCNDGLLKLVPRLLILLVLFGNQVY